MMQAIHFNYTATGQFPTPLFATVQERWYFQQRPLPNALAFYLFHHAPISGLQ
jgi:hypothetical protein